MQQLRQWLFQVVEAKSYLLIVNCLIMKIDKDATNKTMAFSAKSFQVKVTVIDKAATIKTIAFFRLLRREGDAVSRFRSVPSIFLLHLQQHLLRPRAEELRQHPDLQRFFVSDVI
jgi:hypothetical protein